MRYSLAISVHSYSFVDQRLSAPAQDDLAICETISGMTICSGIIKVSYHALLFELLFIDMHRNSAIKGLGLKYVPVQRHCLTL